MSLSADHADGDVEYADANAGDGGNVSRCSVCFQALIATARCAVSALHIARALHMAQPLAPTARNLPEAAVEGLARHS